MKSAKAVVYLLLLLMFVLIGGAAYIYFVMGNVFRNALEGFM